MSIRDAGKCTLRRVHVLIPLYFLLPTGAPATELLRYEGSGTAQTGWTWGYDPGRQGSFANTLLGWSKNDGAMIADSFFPRTIQIRGYYTPAEAAPLAEIAPHVKTPLGDATLHIYETGLQTNQTGGPGWFFLFANSNGARNIASSSTNRMSYYIKLSGMNAWNPANPHGGMMHFGTYTCWNDGTSGTTKACPYESDPQLPQWWHDHVATHGGTVQAGQHYYHYTYLNGTGSPWIHVQMDQRPTHARQASGSGEPLNNHTYPLFGKHYFESLNAFYLEVRYPQSQLTEFWIGPFNFWVQPEQENEVSINTPWVGYYPATGKWEIGFMDSSFNDSGYNNSSKSTYEIRWSTSPITNSNFNFATTIEPEYWEQGTTNRVRRWDSWSRDCWTRFDLPPNTETLHDKLYFAIKDVSSTANGDGHDSPSPNIRSIDYTLRSEAASCSDGEQNQGETNIDCGGPCSPCDTAAPVITSFTISTTAISLVVPVATFTATDAVGVTGYMITETSSAPAAGAAGWSATAPTSFTFSGAGTRTAYAWAKDAAGNVSASLSRNVTITLSDTTAPSVSISSPASQATLKGTVTLSATATDNVGVTKVDFFVDGSLIGSDSSSPYNISWNTASLSSGAHTLTARAYDAAGNVTTSAAALIKLRRLPRAPLLTRVR